MTDDKSSVDLRRFKLDLSGVAPLRRPETRRRIEAIRGYLLIPAPTNTDRMDAASGLGIGVQQFMSLVRAWTLRGEAVAIAKSGANAGASRGTRHHGLPAASRAAAESALRGLPASATNRDAIAAVQIACRSRRTRPPSDSMISYLRMELRRSGGTADGTPGLLVGRATASMPIMRDGVLSLPEVALVVDRRRGSVIAAEMIDGATGHPSADFTTVVAEAASQIDGYITLGSDDEVIAVTLPGARMVSRFTAGRLLAKAIGRWIGGVRLTYGPLASTDPTRALRAKADRPLDPVEAAAVLASAVDAHNASRTDGSGDEVPQIKV